MSACSSTRCTRACRACRGPRRAFHAGRPGADDRGRRSRRWPPRRTSRGASRGGTPRPRSAFWVHQIGGPPCSQRETQMLQPMHSRMSSNRPSSIFLGRNGSAIEGRAAPMMSHCPELIASSMTSGSVNRPTLMHRLLGDLLGHTRVRGLVVDLEEARRAGVLAPVQRADVDVPVVDEVVERCDELPALHPRRGCRDRRSRRAPPGCRSRTARRSRSRRSRLAHLLQHLDA